MEHHECENKSHDYEIDLKFFFTVFRKCWYWILLAALIFGLAAGVYSSAFIPNKYSSTVNMYVDPNNGPLGSYNSSTADALAATYPPVIRHTDEFAKEVALRMAELTDEDGEKMFSDWTYTEDADGNKVAKNWGRVFSMMGTGTIEEGRIFYITFSSTNPEEAYQMALIATEVAPEILNVIVQTGTAKPIGAPVLDTVADSPNVKRNAVVSALVGAVLAYIIFFLYRLFDTTVYGESDLSRFELPILGIVPLFPNTDEKGTKKAKGEKAT